MTTASPDDTTIRRSDSIHSRAQETTTDGSDWQAWTDDNIRVTVEAIGQEVGGMVDGLERKIKALELGLAQANGALDVLRGKGIPGTFNVRGTFDARSVYNRLDVCAYNGASWVAKEDNPGELPGPKWQLLSAAGKRGVAGERGPPGPAGPPSTRFFGASFSPRGMELISSSGPIALFKSIKVDAESFAIKFIANDDSTLTINLLPLFQAYNNQTTGRG